MNKYRLKDKYRLLIIKVLIVASFIWIVSTFISDFGLVDRLNECLQEYDRNYCEMNVK